MERVADGESLRVLVVDDSHDIARTLEVFLRQAGYEVAIASNGRLAVELAQVHKPEVVLLDIDMPELDGYKVAGILRALPETKFAMIVAITGHGTQSDIELATESGFDTHFTKPVEFERLATVLRSAAQQRIAGLS